ncbi:MAG: hypothetical protein FJW79_06695 [Actinobacteria bacterium]|nr:hypothetical protein [Actinomycetota bacterium]
MRIGKPIWVLSTALALVVVILGAVAWAGAPDAAPATRAGDADTLDGHHGAASSASAAQRANRYLWANANGKFNSAALPWSAMDNRYLGRDSKNRDWAGDTFWYVPASEMVFNWGSEALATIYYTHTGPVWVRRTSGTGVVTVVIPMQLPGLQSGEWIRIVDFRVYYRLDNAASYIDVTWMLKMDATTGGHITLVNDGTNRQSTTFDSYVLGCAAAGCSLSWPTGAFLTVVLDLKYGGSGDPHDIGIYGVLLRYSYD